MCVNMIFVQVIIKIRYQFVCIYDPTPLPYATTKSFILFEMESWLQRAIDLGRFQNLL